MLGSRVKGEKCIERARERQLCSSRRASMAIGWEQQSYLLLLFFSPSLIIAPSGPPIIFTLWLGMQGFALDLSEEAAQVAGKVFQGEKTKIIKLYRENEIDWYNNSWEIDSFETEPKQMDGTRRNTRTAFSGKWFPCSIRGLLTRRIPHSIGLLCLITVTILGRCVSCSFLFWGKIALDKWESRPQTKVMAVLTCLLRITHRQTHNHVNLNPPTAHTPARPNPAFSAPFIIRSSPDVLLCLFCSVLEFLFLRGGGNLRFSVCPDWISHVLFF